MAAHGVNPNVVAAFLRQPGEGGTVYNPSPQVAASIATSFAAATGNGKIVERYTAALLKELGLSSVATSR